MDEQSDSVNAVGPQARYFSQLDKGIFEIQQCAACKRHQFFPRVLCNHCGSTELNWIRPSGNGQVYSFSVIRRKPEAGGDYNVALIDLEEGVRLMGRVDGIPLYRLSIGMKVQAKAEIENDKGILVFIPTES